MSGSQIITATARPSRQANQGHMIEHDVMTAITTEVECWPSIGIVVYAVVNLKFCGRVGLQAHDVRWLWAVFGQVL